MAQIKSVVNPTTSTTVIQAAVDAANAATPAGVVPSAEVQKDANGKIVGLNVNLPSDLSQAELTAARDAINSTSGIAKAEMLPQISGYDFTALSVGTKESSLTSGSGQVIALGSSVEGQFEGTTAAEAEGGTGSALMNRDINSTGVFLYTGQHQHSFNNSIEFDAGTNGFASIRSYEIEFDLAAETANAFGTVGGTRGIILRYSPRDAVRFVVETAVDNKWYSRLGNGQLHVSAALPTTYVHCKITYDQTGLMTASLDGVIITHNIGYTTQNPGLYMYLGCSDRDASITMTQKGLKIDNLNITVLDGDVI